MRMKDLLHQFKFKFCTSMMSWCWTADGGGPTIAVIVATIIAMMAMVVVIATTNGSDQWRLQWLRWW